MALERTVLIAQPATEIALMVAREDYAKALKALAVSGLFHPEALGQPAPELRRIRAEIEALREKVKNIISSAGLEERPGEASLKLSSGMDAGLSAALSKLSELIASLSRLAEKLSELRSPESEISKRLRVLEYYSVIDADLASLARARHLRAKVYRISESAWREFAETLAAIEGVVAVAFHGIEPGYASVLAVYPSNLEAEVGKVALRYRAEPLEIPEGWPTSPRRLIEEARRLLEALPKELHARSHELYKALTLLDAAHRLVALLEATRFSKYTAVIHGYVDPSRLGDLESILRSSGVEGFAAIEVRYKPGSELHDGGEVGRPPSIYGVPRLLRPFAELLSMAGHPRPGEVVPLAFMAITLPVIYGLMFPDLGHGIVLVLAGYLLFYKAMRNEALWRLILYFGLAATATGFLAGEFFGPHPLVAGWLAKGVWHGHPPLESPLHLFVEGGQGEELAVEAKHLLFNVIYLSLVVGGVVMTLGSALSIVNGFILRDREISVAGMGKTLVFGSILLALVAGAAASRGAPLEGAASVLRDAGLTLVPQTTLGLVVRLLFTLGVFAVLLAPILYGHGSVGERVIGGVMEAFDILLMAIGNTASFMRIMGLILAHSGLMFGFTILAMVSGPVIGPIAYVFGNILTIGLEALVAYAHSLRLHFYEMFSKFYLDEGRAYTPLTLPPTVKLEA